MKILVLGDVMGASGRNALNKKLPQIINSNAIDFIIVNGENSADDGKGITQDIAEEFFKIGVDVITSGNHIWDKQETANYINIENRLLRPANLVEGSPGRGYEKYFTKNKKYKIGVVNLMGNVFMRKTEDVFLKAIDLQKKIKFKKESDFIIVDIHGEITSEKTAMGYFFDGKATAVVGTHTHIPTADTRILNGGTAFQTDIGMCGDYDSIIGMNAVNSINKFLKKKEAVNHFPSLGEGSLSGIIVEANEKTGLALNVERVIRGGIFK